MKVLVLAPRFPSVNQAWMDTYLEQLVLNDIDFAIYTLRAGNRKYNLKVDRLKLLDRVVPVNLKNSHVIAYALKKIVRHPVATTSKIFELRKLAEKLSNSASARIISTFRLYYFSALKPLFNDITVIHSHSEKSAYLFLHLALLTNKPMMLTYHGLPPEGVNQLSPEKRKILYSMISTVTVNTDFAGKQVTGVGASPESIRIMPQGVPIREYVFKPLAAPETGESCRLLTVGRFHRDKGQLYGLHTLKRLVNAGYRVEWHFVGVGEGLEELKSTAVRYDLTEFVHFHSEMKQTELQNLYHQTHIYVMTSIDKCEAVETQGVVLQEAQASGCLVVATGVGGVPECIDDKKNGLLVRPCSSKSLFNGIRFFLENTQLWAEFRNAARKNVESRFSADVIGRKMVELLGSTGPGRG